MKDNYPRAKQVLQSLISGADPATGCDLPKDSILNRVDVIRALLSSIEAIEQVTARAARRALLPDGVGQPWTEEEEQRLKEAFANGDAVSEIAGAHKRTVRAIEARLERLGLITVEQRITSNSFTGTPRKGDQLFVRSKSRRTGIQIRAGVNWNPGSDEVELNRAVMPTHCECHTRHQRL
jgi:hypothetical protein